MATVTKRRKKVAAKPSSKLKKPPRRTATPKPNPPNRPAAKVGKMIYYFSKSRTDGDGTMKPLLGGKGANLAAMTSIGLPVPPGFTITTEVCMFYYKNGKKFPPTLLNDMQNRRRLAGKRNRQEIRRHEKSAARFGPLRRPRFDARHDGHDSEPRPQRQNRRSA